MTLDLVLNLKDFKYKMITKRSKPSICHSGRVAKAKSCLVRADNTLYSPNLVGDGSKSNRVLNAFWTKNLVRTLAAK